MTAIPTVPEAVSGVQLAQGVGVQPARGFWADAWAQVTRRPGAIAALTWLGVVAFFAVGAPLIASGHPFVLRELGAGGDVVQTRWPLLENLRAPDLGLLVGAGLAVPWIVLAPKGRRAGRLGAALYAAVLATAIIVLGTLLRGYLGQRHPPQWARALRTMQRAEVWIPLTISAAIFTLGVLVPAIGSVRKRLALVLAACTIAGVSLGVAWRPPLPIFDYVQREVRGEISAAYTLVPFSPSQRFSELDRRPPGTTLGKGLGLAPEMPAAGRTFQLGTDAFGQDVLSQLLAACRLSISIGLVSTGIAVLIGVTIGSLMGYFGGWVDLLLFRVVEIFMAVPLLFLLIVAAAVLPPEMRTAYTMMAIIGCFTWTGAARFTRAEFLKLRSQDFVQSARAVGLPLRSILFRHMLPNGVTPVLVEASFAVAAAISIEATLSYLGLGPTDQASWGKLLASAMNAEGQFKWWLAVFPGAAIFLTVLSYNIIGEALRDAIDPKLKKARV